MPETSAAIMADGAIFQILNGLGLGCRRCRFGPSGGADRNEAGGQQSGDDQEARRRAGRRTGHQEGAGHEAKLGSHQIEAENGAAALAGCGIGNPAFPGGQKTGHGQADDELDQHPPGHRPADIERRCAQRGGCRKTGNGPDMADLHDLAWRQPGSQHEAECVGRDDCTNLQRRRAL
jgi:hypothetical protein